MEGPKELLQKILQETKAHRSVAFCVVVETSGSTPQGPGAMMIVDYDSHTIGTIGGGCVEAAIRRRAFEIIESKTSELVQIDLNNETASDEGLICGGTMKIAIVFLPRDQWYDDLTNAINLLEEGKPAEIAINIDANLRYRLRLEAEPHLVIAGAGHISRELAQLGTNLGFLVTVIDNRADYANSQRFPAPIQVLVGDIAETLKKHPIHQSTYIVVVTRGHTHDQDALSAVLRSPACYIGMIGSRRKVKLIFETLKEEGFSEDLVKRVTAPIGLPIKAITVQEIAISIMAQLIQVRRENHGSPVTGPL